MRTTACSWETDEALSNATTCVVGFDAFGHILRKEVIQPQVPLRLPCYDFTPVADPAVDGYPPCGLTHRLKAEPTPMV